MDRGGLLYPSQALKDLVAAMEDAFTHCFSFNKLKADSIMGLISCLSINKLDMVGCAQHSVEITNQVIRFFVITRLHVLVAGENASKQGKREKMKYLKLRRTT